MLAGVGEEDPVVLLKADDAMMMADELRKIAAVDPHDSSHAMGGELYRFGKH